MALTKERKQEMGLAVLKIHLKSKGIHLNPENVKRDLGNLSKELEKFNFKKEELFEFMREMIQELLNESFEN